MEAKCTKKVSTFLPKLHLKCTRQEVLKMHRKVAKKWEKYNKLFKRIKMLLLPNTRDLHLAGFLKSNEVP